MKKIEINTTCKKLLADVYTPVGIYLRVRDRFRDTILLESTDHHAAENSWSFICINAIGGIEITSLESIEFKFRKQHPERVVIKERHRSAGMLWEFMQNFAVNKGDSKEANMHRVVRLYHV
jgi:anthranilate synthase component 1